MHFVKAKSILSANNGMNIYRGCSHGCIYCDSRSTCYQMNHAFEDIEVKINAPELLELKLMSKRKPCMISTGAMCDPYIHIEEELKLTRKCLEIIDKYNCGAVLLTKSARVLRDVDLIEQINNKTKAVVQMTLTCYDDNLCRLIEPNVSVTSERFQVLMEMKRRGIPTIVWMGPILPYIDDSLNNIKGLLYYCLQANVKGIIMFGAGMTLREGNREYYYQKLDELFPGLKNKYIKKFGNAYEIASDNNGIIMDYFYKFCKEHNIMSNVDEIFNYLAKYPEKEDNQLSLF